MFETNVAMAGRKSGSLFGKLLQKSIRLPRDREPSSFLRIFKLLGELRGRRSIPMTAIAALAFLSYLTETRLAQVYPRAYRHQNDGVMQTGPQVGAVKRMPNPPRRAIDPNRYPYPNYQPGYYQPGYYPPGYYPPDYQRSVRCPPLSAYVVCN